MARSILDTHGIVVITGKPGSGKTWCALNLLRTHGDRIPVILSERKDWLTLPLENKLKKGYIILIDDIFGKQSFFDERNYAWQQIYLQIGYHIKKNNVHVIIVSRSHIFHKYSSATSDITLYGPDRSADLDILKMINIERENMIGVYCKCKENGKTLNSEERKKAAEMTPDIGFPLWCQLFMKTEDFGLDFFVTPIEIIFQTLTEIYEKDMKMYQLLELILMENGCLTPSIMEPQKIGSPILSAHELPDLCRSLKGTVLKEKTSPESSTEYSFISEFHMNSFFLHFVAKQTGLCIRNAPLTLILKLVTLQGESNKQYVLKTNERKLLCERLVSEISDKTVNEILDHSCFRHHGCVKLLVEHILRSKNEWKVKEQHQMYPLFSSEEMFDKIKMLGEDNKYAKVISVPYEKGKQTKIQLFSYDHIFCWLIMKDHKEAAMEFYRQCNKVELCETAASALSCAIFKGNVDLYAMMRDSGFKVSAKNLKALTASTPDDTSFEDEILNSTLLKTVLDETLKDVLLLSVHLNHIRQMEMFVQEICQRKMHSDTFDHVLIHKLLQLSMTKTTKCLFDSKANSCENRIFECLRSAGAKVDKTICLFIASCQDNDVILKQFIETSRIIQDEDGVSPLHLASQYGSPDTIDVFLDAGYDVNLTDNNMETPLHFAVGDNENVVIKGLIRKGADITMRDRNGRTVFHSACESGNTDAVKTFLKYIRDVNIQDNQGMTGLHYIVNSNAPNSKAKVIIDLMMKVGIDINKKYRLGETSFFKAVLKGSLSISERLLSHGADPNISDHEDRTPLHVCSDLEIIDLLVQVGVDINKKDSLGETSLFKAVSKESLSISEHLLNHGADPNISDHEDRTPLHVCSELVTVDLARILLKKVASVNSQDHIGNTSLHVAMNTRHFEFIPLLMEYGVDICIQNEIGETFLYLCEEKSPLDETSHLQQLCPMLSAINVANNNGTTPLHIAALFGETNVIRLMLDEGADPNVKDKAGDTPMHYQCNTDYLSQNPFSLFWTKVLIQTYRTMTETHLYIF